MIHSGVRTYTDWSLEVVAVTVTSLNVSYCDNGSPSISVIVTMLSVRVLAYDSLNCPNIEYIVIERQLETNFVLTNISVGFLATEDFISFSYIVRFKSNYSLDTNF